MLKTLKDALNNSLTWLLFLVGCVLFLWRKEKDLEFELEETKANEKIKSDKEAVREADSTAAASADDYQSLRDAYLRGHKDDT